MKRRTLSRLALSIGLMAVSCGSGLAQTTTTTTTVYRTSAPQVVNLPGTGSYVVVDPLTGEAKGILDPTTGLLNGQLASSGLLVTDKLSGQVVAVVDANGKLIDMAASPASDTLVATIDARRAALAQEIADALTKERLNGAQAAPLRAELDRLAAIESAAKQSGGVITFAEAYPIAIGLNALALRIDPLVSVSDTPVLISSHFAVVNGQTIWVTDLGYRKLSLARRVDDEYAAGRLSGRQKECLEQQLNEISAREAKYREKGELSGSKRDKIASKYDRVQILLDKDVAIIKDKRTKIGLKTD